MEFTCPLYHLETMGPIDSNKKCQRCIKEFSKSIDERSTKDPISSEIYYRMGLEHLQDNEKCEAFFCFKMAARKKHPDAIYQLALFYAQGGTEDFSSHAKVCMHDAAYLGSTMAWSFLHPEDIRPVDDYYEDEVEAEEQEEAEENEIDEAEGIDKKDDAKAVEPETKKPSFKKKKGKARLGSAGGKLYIEHLISKLVSADEMKTKIGLYHCVVEMLWSPHDPISDDIWAQFVQERQIIMTRKEKIDVNDNNKRKEAEDKKAKEIEEKISSFSAKYYGKVLYHKDYGRGVVTKVSTVDGTSIYATVKFDNDGEKVFLVPWSIGKVLFEDESCYVYEEKKKDQYNPPKKKDKQIW